MRIILLLLLIVVTAHAAETVEADLSEPKKITPAAVKTLVEAYVKSARPIEKKPAAPEDVRRDFERAFLTGFTQPNVTYGSPTDADLKGLAAGQKYRRDHPDKINEILEGYGYTATEADGLWKFGFETSEFKSKKTPKENWWITVLREEGEVLADHVPRVRVKTSQDGVQVHVVGFLSPPGHYGHFGVGARELFATSITAPAKSK